MQLKVNKVSDPFRQLICEYTLDGADKLNSDSKNSFNNLS